MYFPFSKLYGWGKRFAAQPQTICSEIPSEKKADPTPGYRGEASRGTTLITAARHLSHRITGMGRPARRGPLGSGGLQHRPQGLHSPLLADGSAADWLLQREFSRFLDYSISGRVICQPFFAPVRPARLIQT